MLPLIVTQVQYLRPHLKSQHEPETGLVQPHRKSAKVLLNTNILCTLFCSPGGDVIPSYILLFKLISLVDLISTMLI